jgi:hypothetical protein
LVGIGGGIFLSPLLNLMKWDTPRKIAATSSVFILVNSVSGIFGQLSKLFRHQLFQNSEFVFCCIHWRADRFQNVPEMESLIIKRMTAVLFW